MLLQFRDLCYLPPVNRLTISAVDIVITAPTKGYSMYESVYILSGNPLYGSIKATKPDSY
jgi:hypothetical protein